MLAGFISELLRRIRNLRNLMAAKLPPLPRQALVELYPATDRVTIHLALGGRVRTMDRSGSEQLKRCLQRIQLSACEKTGKKPAAEAPPPPGVELLFRSQSVDPELSNSEAWRDRSVLRVGTDEFLVRVNLPRVLGLSLPRHTLEGCPVVPRAELSRCEFHDCRWSWCRMEDPAFCPDTLAQALCGGTAQLSEQLMSTFKLVPVSDEFVYCPGAKDLGHKLLVHCQPLDPDSREGVGISCYGVTAEGARPCPGGEGQVDRFAATRQPTDKQHLRVLSYNILADVWTKSKDCQAAIYPHCSALTLDVDYRQALTNRELIGFHPDILCLQEVTKRRYTDYLMPAMECAGFSGHFASKAGEMPEGEVILYRRDRFEAIDTYSLHSGEYMKIPENLVLYNSLLLWGEDVAFRFSSLGTIFQICVLRDKSSPSRVYLVANTHLHSRPKVPYIRLFQLALLVRHLEGLLQRYKESGENTVSVILCGDLNASPNSGLIEFLQTGVVESNNLDWQPWALEMPTQFVFPGISLSHSLRLLNACGPAEFTHFAGHFVATLDYIFCDSHTLSTHQVAPMPALWEVSRETALPNSWFPSDHLPIVCDLNIK